ncbi:mevalonate kinase isoform X2 [Cephus cinctus]|uniref:Mevalonate kinase n=1 Tax=Cephus cinctus TaxID=211228 RepID=A0AAJ7FI41_CEPCN|nr:mevalonate kinase isoform X2 [Cephus cinctus]
MIEFKVSAPGKIILYGEHAVVYGKTAVAGTVNLRTTLQFIELPHDQLNIQLSIPKSNLLLNVQLNQIQEFFFGSETTQSIDTHETLYAHVQKFVEKIGYVNLQQQSTLESIFYLLISVSQAQALTLKPFKLHLDGVLPIGAGLGSSASFSVCLAACFIHWSHLQNSQNRILDEKLLEKISNYAFNCEKIMHHTPSGIDNTICTYGSFVEFRKGEEPVPIITSKKMRVLVIDTKVQRSTKVLIERLRNLKEKYPDIFHPIFDSIDNVSKEAVKIIRQIHDLPDDHSDLYEGYKKLMSLIEINQGLLVACNVSHPSLDKICMEARRFNLSAKLSGAGGGGCAYVLLMPDTSENVIANFSEKLSSDGYTVQLTTLGGPGVEIHS